MQVEVVTRRKRGKREYLIDSETKALLNELNKFFETMVEVKRIRNDKHQTLETLINEETLLLAKYLKHEISLSNPRIAYARTL